MSKTAKIVYGILFLAVAVAVCFMIKEFVAYQKPDGPNPQKKDRAAAREKRIDELFRSLPKDAPLIGKRLNREELKSIGEKGEGSDAMRARFGEPTFIKRSGTLTSFLYFYEPEEAKASAAEGEGIGIQFDWNEKNTLVSWGIVDPGFHLLESFEEADYQRIIPDGTEKEEVLRMLGNPDRVTTLDGRTELLHWRLRSKTAYSQLLIQFRDGKAVGVSILNVPLPATQPGTRVIVL